MTGTEFQPLNPSVFVDRKFVVEPNTTPEQTQNPDDKRFIVSVSSGSSSGVSLRYEKTYRLTDGTDEKIGHFFRLDQVNFGEYLKHGLFDLMQSVFEKDRQKRSDTA